MKSDLSKARKWVLLLALAGAASQLTACGQKGPLVRPDALSAPAVSESGRSAALHTAS